MMENGLMDGGMGLWMLLSIFFWILLLVGIVLLVVWAVQKAWRGGRGGTDQSASEILKQQYARGELAKEEYAEKKRDIL